MGLAGAGLGGAAVAWLAGWPGVAGGLLLGVAVGLVNLWLFESGQRRAAVLEEKLRVQPRESQAAVELAGQIARAVAGRFFLRLAVAMAGLLLAVGGGSQVVLGTALGVGLEMGVSMGSVLLARSTARSTGVR